jgi:uroporphyrinogen-III synthase
MPAKHSILLTRSESEGLSWGRELEAAGHRVRYLPVQVYMPLKPGPVDLFSHDLVVFTSLHAVEFFDAAYPTARTLPAAAVGKRTAQAAQAAGFAVELTASEAYGAALAGEILARYPATSRLLLPCSERYREELPAILRNAGFPVTLLPLYRPQPLPRPSGLDAMLGEATDLLCFSPSQVEALLEWTDGQLPPHLTLWAVGKTTVRAFPAHCTVHALPAPRVGAFIEALKAESGSQ